jgi:hypothetical protein
MSMHTWLAAAMALFLALPAAAAPPSEERVRDQLKKIFERPEFQRRHEQPSGPDDASEPAPPKRSNEKSGVKRRDDSSADEPEGGLFEWLQHLRGGSPFLFWLLVGVAALLLILLLLYVAKSARRAVYVSAGPDQAAPDQAQRRRLSASLRAEADEQARAGDFTAAVRSLFLSLIYAFDESGSLLFKPAFTNREYLDGCAGRPTLVSGLRPFVDVLDVNWYGQRPTTEREYRACLERYERLLPEAG